MELTLLRKLINNSIVRPEIEIDAKYVGRGIDGAPTVLTCGNFVINSLFDNGDSIILSVSDTVSGGKQQISHTSIERIEGMSPKRLAETYGINDDGGKIKEKVRRGRKPRRASADVDQ